MMEASECVGQTTPGTPREQAIGLPSSQPIRRRTHHGHKGVPLRAIHQSPEGQRLRRGRGVRRRVEREVSTQQAAADVRAWGGCRGGGG